MTAGVERFAQGVRHAAEATGGAPHPPVAMDPRPPLT